jgi:hypothetical protein
MGGERGGRAVGIMHVVGGGSVHAVGTVYNEGRDVVGTVHVIGDGHVGTVRIVGGDGGGVFSRDRGYNGGHAVAPHIDSP